VYLSLPTISPDHLIYWLDILGTLAFAISGTLAAMDKNFDLFGTFVIAFVTSLGGGTLRDILIGNQPVSWMTNDPTLIMISLCVLITLLFQNILRRARNTLFLFDAIGIGIFTIIGLNIALAEHLSLGVSLIMGMISAVFGGVLRDTLCNEVPLIFRQEIYATACLLGGGLYLMADTLHLGDKTALVLSISCVVIIRLLAVKFKLKLPTPTPEP